MEDKPDDDKIEFRKECFYCRNYEWCGLYRGEWHCGCLERLDPYDEWYHQQEEE